MKTMRVDNIQRTNTLGRLGMSLFLHNVCIKSALKIKAATHLRYI